MNKISYIAPEMLDRGTVVARTTGAGSSTNEAGAGQTRVKNLTGTAGETSGEES